MKKLLLLLPLLLACSKNCDDEKQALYNQYSRNLQYAATPEAVAKLQRDYNKRLNSLNCD